MAATTPFDIGYFTLSAILPAGMQIDQTVFDLIGFTRWCPHRRLPAISM